MADSFHTKKLCSRLYLTEIEFYQKKKQKIVFEPPFWGLRGNVRTPSIACWKARGRLPIHRNYTFSYLLQLSCYKRKSVKVGIFRRGGSLSVQISDGRGVAHQPLLVSEN